MKRRKFGKGRLSFVLVGAVAAFFLFSPTAPREVVYPFARAKVWFSRVVLSRLAGVFAGARASAENAQLKSELNSYALLNGEYARLEEENRRLRAAMGFAERTRGRWLPANVISRSERSVFGTCGVLIDRGSADGIRKNAPVAVSEGLVGLVTEVTRHTALVRFPVDPEIAVACEIVVSSSKRLRGILSADGGGRLVLRHLSRFRTLPPRSKVFTSGLGGVFPKGLVVGETEEVVYDEDRFPLGIEISPAVEYSVLTEVFVRRED